MDLDKSPNNKKGAATPAREGSKDSVNSSSLSPSLGHVALDDTSNMMHTSIEDRRRYTRSQSKASLEFYVEESDSDDDEAEDHVAAIRAGFNPTEMEEHEKQYFPEYVPYETDYVYARNYILMLWKRKPGQFLSWSMVTPNMAVRFLLCLTNHTRFPLL